MLRSSSSSSFSRSRLSPSSSLYIQEALPYDVKYAVIIHMVLYMGMAEIEEVGYLVVLLAGFACGRYHHEAPLRGQPR